jgi:hypothetical protein
MQTIQNLLIRITKHWWAVALAFILNFASFAILFSLEDRFEALTGVPVYDTQNDLTRETLREQLPLYVGEAREAYLYFAAFDFVFPFVAGVFVAVIWTLLLRLNTFPLAQRMLRWGVPLLALTVILFDWMENVSLLAVLQTGGSSVSVDAALVFKQLKLAGLFITGPVSLVLTVFLMVNMISRFSRTRSTFTLGRKTS